ncbi:helix-turn-helix transcriptional regulator [Actinokineospora sp. NBRC 105648]|uniref:helix-turn-helix domain-containing protein n=1 Tax=Actinokineospora sp. NBRC 105648 TaxID=3032206 RepID=UPI00249FBEDE|nr:helix-turn-helix transcriptional regulator [Actinokineospora sp. NBRC 105648]GLZ40935.1 hypothetical protein Acsp05_45590 [Actinokineospora sp. NBRC 105648]
MDRNSVDNSLPTLGSTIRQARQEAGLSIRQLAPMVGAHHSVLAKIEAGDVTRPTGVMLQNIARALELDVTDLLRFVGVDAPLPPAKVYFRRAYNMTDKEQAAAEAAIQKILDQREKE